MAGPQKKTFFRLPLRSCLIKIVAYITDLVFLTFFHNKKLNQLKFTINNLFHSGVFPLCLRSKYGAKITPRMFYFYRDFFLSITIIYFYGKHIYSRKSLPISEGISEGITEFCPANVGEYLRGLLHFQWWSTDPSSAQESG